GLPFKDGREMVEYHWQRRDQPLSEPSTPPTNVCAALTKQLCCRVAKGFRYGWKSPEGSRYVHWRHGSDPPREEYVQRTPPRLCNAGISGPHANLWLRHQQHSALREPSPHQ